MLFYPMKEVEECKEAEEEEEGRTTIEGIGEDPWEVGAEDSIREIETVKDTEEEEEGVTLGQGVEHMILIDRIAKYEKAFDSLT